ncbi:hypothetical protein TCDM_08745 [Trypanosoma cruzi Dm28c]|uniref:Uncharacterized protein n=1 Tax=Trypanosoma cruzi Dm28c TaxID=1416333 RepID=V5ARM6_TRYCR|nr:hypothetical protein TCDM_08745 [Trypanosoma cruzi Dm28c]
MVACRALSGVTCFFPLFPSVAHKRCSTPAGKETRAEHSLSILLMATKKDNSRHTQPPAHATKEAFKSTAMCILCVCACRNTKHKSRRKEAEYVEGRTKMYSGGAWRKQQQEDRSNS